MSRDEIRNGLCRQVGDRSNEPDKMSRPEEIEDEAVKNAGKKKKARLRTRGPYRQASTKNLPDRSSHH